MRYPPCLCVWTLKQNFKSKIIGKWYATIQNQIQQGTKNKRFARVDPQDGRAKSPRPLHYHLAFTDALHELGTNSNLAVINQQESHNQGAGKVRRLLRIPLDATL
jgi:hypothetical protein